MDEILDYLPFPVDAIVFGTTFVVGAVLLTTIAYGANAVLKGYALSDELKRVLDGIGQFFQWLFELPGTGEEVKA